MEIRIPFLRWMESASARALFDPYPDKLLNQLTETAECAGVVRGDVWKEPC